MGNMRSTQNRWIGVSDGDAFVSDSQSVSQSMDGDDSKFPMYVSYIAQAFQAPPCRCQRFLSPNFAGEFVFFLSFVSLLNLNLAKEEDNSRVSMVTEPNSVTHLHPEILVACSCQLSILSLYLTI